MGAKGAWFSLAVRAGDEYEIHPEKPGRKPAFKYLSKLVRTAAQESFTNLLAPGGKGGLAVGVIAVSDSPASFHGVSSGRVAAKTACRSFFPSPKGGTDHA